MSKRRVELNAAATALLFAALGNETRLGLLQRLSEDGPASITALAESFRDVTRQGVTKHLNVLAGAGVIEGLRAGREHLWAVKPKPLEDARRYLELVGRSWDDALARLKTHVERT
jgi:DNA-binding transcriptional ArsR family regulator